MIQNKLDGMKTFNGCYLNSCYYHQLIAGLSILGLSADNVLMMFYISVDKDFYIRKELNDERVLHQVCGCRFCKKNLTAKCLTHSIDKGYPILAGIDCFYLKTRRDTYRRQHISHFLLVFGYDLTRDIVNVVDHNYVNSYRYEEKEIPLSELLYASSKFDKKNRRTNCTVLKRKKFIHKGYKSIWEYIEGKDIDASKENSVYNLERIKELFNGETRILKEQSGIIEGYLMDLKFYFQLLTFTEAIAQRGDLKNITMKLAAAYSFLLSLFWKMSGQNNYDCVLKVKDRVCKKIETMIELEDCFYREFKEMVSECVIKK